MSVENKILETSLRLFSKYGYNGVSTKKIAQRAGVNEVTIFRKFKNKSNLFEQVITNCSEEGNIVEHLKKETVGILEKDLMTFAKTFYYLISNNICFFLIQVKELEDDSPKFTNILDCKNYFKWYLEEKKKEGEFKGDPETIAVLLISSIMGIFTFKIFNKTIIKDVNIDELIEIEVKRIILENHIRKY